MYGLDEMSHHTTSVSGVENPAKGFCEAVRDGDDAWDMLHINFICFSPVLDGEVLDVDVTRTLGWNAAADHVDRRHIVNVKRCWSLLLVAEFEEYRTKVLSMLGRGNCSKEFSFRA